MVQHPLDRGYEVAGVCREDSAPKLDAFQGRIAVTIPGDGRPRGHQARGRGGCDGVLTVLAPFGDHGYARGTAQAVVGHASPGVRLVFSCGRHITWYRMLIGQETDVNQRQFPACRHQKAPTRMPSRLSACTQHQPAEAIGSHSTGEVNG